MSRCVRLVALCALLACGGDPFDASGITPEGRWLLSERIDTDAGLGS